ncbi:O-methyltransferase [Actinoallomurus spadix]|uniref:Class I SAM-dependent methyltransferase n=1 Tax=Actinoallomurus spadix TaxID=79912 RepID=A0ABP3H773_9ACTN|nr:O-methyltransferase [Actinoallomurus spadix]MCO5988883.1 O-methyltransferase [Actinoallomurus spadix]
MDDLTEMQPYVEKTMPMTPELMRYVRAQAGPLTAAQRSLMDATLALGGVAEMQIPPEQGVLLTLLARLISARTVVEVGTFTGYSTMALAEGVDTDGTVITLDITDEWSAIATEAWRAAGVAERIRQVHGPAAESLRTLPDEPFVDLVFIDADKVGYVDYWELLVPRVRPGGLLIADNVLYAGEAVSPDATGNAQAIRDFNAHVLADDRVESVLLTVADGLTLARKK